MKFDLYAAVQITAGSVQKNGLLFAVFAVALILLIVTLLYKANALTTRPTLLAVLVASVAVLAVRAVLFDHVSNDYAVFLSDWMNYFRTNGGFAALGGKIGDYNFPYLYFLALFSYIPIYDLYLIKFLSIVFDIILAFSAMKLVSLRTEKPSIMLTAFFTVLTLPTVITNSALWGQCDSIYTAFGLLGLYYGLREKPVLSVAMAAVAFAFKLQIIFLLPIYAVLLIAGKIRIRHFFVFPAIYLLSVLPAVLLGRPITDAITVYTNQVGTYSAYLTLNAPSIFAFFARDLTTPGYSVAGVIAAFIMILLLLGYALLRRKKLSNRTILLIATLMVIFIPYLLPSMHERYFYLADILSVVCVFMYPRLLPVAVLVQLASWSGYQTYLYGGGIGVRIGAVLLLCAGIFVAFQTIYSLENEAPNPIKSAPPGALGKTKP